MRSTDIPPFFVHPSNLQVPRKVAKKAVATPVLEHQLFRLVACVGSHSEGRLQAEYLATLHALPYRIAVDSH
jgi:hypothetical protein